MSRAWLSLEGVPAEGREFTFADQEMWAAHWKEFDLPYAPARALEATLNITVQGRGCLVKGHLAGSVATQCSRCAEDFELEVDTRFTLYEEVPDEGDEDAGQALVRDQGDGLELNVQGLIWEQFLLALPQRALCDRNCKGLCPVCGRNLNQGACDCRAEAGDPRMAVFRSLNMDDKKKK